MKRVAVMGAYPESLVSFRAPLIQMIQRHGVEVSAAAGEPLGPVRKALETRNVKCTSIRLQRTGINPFYDLLTFFDFYRFLRKTRPDIALSYTAKPIVYGLLAARFAGVKCRFALIEGLGFAFSGETLKHRCLVNVLRILYRIGLSGCSSVFFLNPDDQKYFEEHGLLSAGTRSAHIDGIGIDLQRFSPFPIPEVPSFLMVGRLLKDKGVIEYVEAAKNLKARYPSVRFRLAGGFDANPSGISKDILNEWISQGSIEYLGHLSDTRSAYADCSVFVLPSYREGMPVAVMEAMACGRPIVTTSVAGCKETVINGVNGFVVPPRNISELISAMEKFILRPSISIILGEESRRIAESRFDQNKVNERIMKIMEIGIE